MNKLARYILGSYERGSVSKSFWGPYRRALVQGRNIKWYPSLVVAKVFYVIYALLIGFFGLMILSSPDALMITITLGISLIVGLNVCMWHGARHVAQIDEFYAGTGVLEETAPRIDWLVMVLIVLAIGALVL